MSRSLGVWFLAIAVIGCGMDDEEGTEEVTEIAKPIFNGSTDFSGLEWMRIRTARLELPYGCSGTVLDGRTILTARHCVTTNGSPFGNIVDPPSLIRVRIDGGIARSAQMIVPMEPTGDDVHHDVALVFLSAANAIRDAQGRPIFTPLEVIEPSYLVDRTIRISGWGLLNGADPNSGNVLRHGTMIVDDDLVSPWVEQPRLFDGIQLRVGSSAQDIRSGDSGGPFWGGTFSAGGTLPRGIIGVTSAHGPGTNTALGTRVHSIRGWARFQMSMHHGFLAGFGFSRDFTAAFPFRSGVAYAPDGGNTGSWSLSSGQLVQSSNVGPSHMVWEFNDPVRDFAASVDLQSPDNDGAGIVFHHAAPDAFYYCEASDQHNELRIRSRIGETITTLASVPWNGTFASTKTMTVQGLDIIYLCAFDGVVVAAADTRMPVGSIGLFQDHQEGVRFDNLNVTGSSPP